MRSRAPVLVVALLGVVAGAALGAFGPEAAYGYQLVAAIVGAGAMGVGVLLWRFRRLLASIVLAAGAGLLLGIALGLALRPGSLGAAAATIDVSLRTPAVATLRTSSGECLVVDDRLLLLQSGDAVALVDGTSIAVTLSQGSYRPAPGASPDDRIVVDVRVASALEDGTPTETWMGSDSTSTVVVTGAPGSGTVDFSGLVLRPGSEQPDPIDVSGTISWTCEPAS